MLNSILKTESAAVASLLFLVWLVIVACSQSGVKVVVANQGSKPITKLQLAFTGGQQNLPELAPGADHKFMINPSGESRIDISFIDANGNTRTTKLDVYLGKDYEGEIAVRIGSDSTVNWAETTPTPKGF
jgi:hypothetical protein